MATGTATLWRAYGSGVEETRTAESKKQSKEKEQESLRAKKTAEKAERDRLADEARVRAASDAKERERVKLAQKAAVKKDEVLTKTPCSALFGKCL